MHTKLTATLATLLVTPAIALSGAVHAAVPSDIEGGDIYRVKNVTKGTDFTDPASADACDVLQYKVRIHNGGPDEVLHNVTAQAAFPTGAQTKNTSIMILRADNANPSSTSDTATVNISTAQTMAYINGSTQLLDADGNVIQTLPDGITGAGVKVADNLGISIAEKRFVQFQEKINCPAQPCQPGPGQVVDSKGNCVTPPPKPPVTPPSNLVNTGPGEVAALFSGATVAGVAGYRMVLARRFRDED